MFFGNGVSNFNGAGSVNMMNTPMGSVGTFVGDGTANFAGNSGMVAAGVGQVGFAGHGIGFNQGFGSGQTNGVGNVNMGRIGRGVIWPGPHSNYPDQGDGSIDQGEGSIDQGEGSNEQEGNVRMGRWGTNLAYMEFGSEGSNDQGEVSNDQENIQGVGNVRMGHLLPWGHYRAGGRHQGEGSNDQGEGSNDLGEGSNDQENIQGEGSNDQGNIQGEGSNDQGEGSN